MPTQYPGNLDNFTNPVPTDKLNNPTHAGQHTNSNDAIEAIETYVGVANSTDPASLTNRVKVLEQGGGGGGTGTVTDVTATAPVTSTGGTAPVIGMPAATVSVNGYLTSVDFTTFNNKQPSDADLTAIAALSGASGLLRKTAVNTWTLDTSNYALVGASYTKIESDNLYPTKAGVGASGTWAISISGNANFASTADIANWSKAVENLNNPTDDIKQWIGTQAQYDALGSWDNTTFYTITDAVVALDYLPLAGGTMSGPISWSKNSQTGKIDIIVDPLSSTGDVMTVESDAGIQVVGPYIVLDTTNLQTTMPGAVVNAALTVAAIDAFGVVSLGYTSLPPPSYSVTDITAVPVVIKATGTAPPTAWVSLGLEVTLGQDIPVGTGNVGFEGIFINPTVRSGSVEFALQINNSAINARDIVTQIAPNFNQTIAMQLPMLNPYVAGDIIGLVARVISNDNNQFSLNMANNANDLGTFRIYTTGSSGGGGGVNSVGGVAPIASSGGADPQISMPAATGSQSGYLSAANFSVFNGKANAATTLAGYGITDAVDTFSIQTVLGNKTFGGTCIFNGGLTGFQVKAGAVDGSALIGLYADSQAQNTRSAYFGFPTPSANHMYLTNEMLNGNLALSCNGSGVLTFKGGVVLDANNYTNYTVTKTGTGASGTWGISISGISAGAPWAGITGTPTTRGGYGITDAQETLVNQVNIKSINGVPLLGAGDLVIASGGGTVTAVTGVAPIVSSLGTTPQISMPAASTSVDGYLSASNFNVFNGKQNSDADLTAIASLSGTSGLLRKTAANTWTLETASYALVGASYTKAESDTNYPTKAGVGATGNWGISVTGNSATTTAVNDNGAGTSLKMWYGTEAEYIAIGTKDPTTLYFRSA